VLRSGIRLETNSRELKMGIWRKIPELWPDKWILDHDSDAAHDALRFCEFLAKKSITKWTVHFIHT
jgi:hypothetical protein